MIEITDNQMAKVRELCAEYGVVKLELIGSAATGVFDCGRDHPAYPVNSALPSNPPMVPLTMCQVSPLTVSPD